MDDDDEEEDYEELETNKIETKKKDCGTEKECKLLKNKKPNNITTNYKVKKLKHWIY